MSNTTLVGVSSMDITPKDKIHMCGFAARSEPAIGTHDPLTARAIIFDDVAILAVDVLGIDAQTSHLIREKSILPTNNIMVHATHTHGGPVSMRDRLGAAADETYLEFLVEQCVKAIDAAYASRRPATLTIANGKDPKIGKNRRHAGGVTDTNLPILRAFNEEGEVFATLISYACHPVVLGADNLLWTADYPHYIRSELEKNYPNSTSIFLTGCIGDVNTGHSAHSSISLSANPKRTFAEAERIGRLIANCALNSEQQSIQGAIKISSADVEMHFERLEQLSNRELADTWLEVAKSADPLTKSLYTVWADWALNTAQLAPEPMDARVSSISISGVPLIGLPGEIFADIGVNLREQLPQNLPAFVIGFADDNPGYIPSQNEYGFGGYEVDEAHRYYGLPATFKTGTAEALRDSALKCWHLIA